jgi:hypothetical protein
MVLQPMLLLATLPLLSKIVISFCNILSEKFLFNVSKDQNENVKKRTSDGRTLASFHDTISFEAF